MLVITSHVFTEDAIGVQIEGRGTSEIEIRLAYEALSKVVDDIEKEGENKNG